MYRSGEGSYFEYILCSNWMVLKCYFFFLGISVFCHNCFVETVFNSSYLMMYVTSVLFVSEYYRWKWLVGAGFLILVRMLGTWILTSPFLASSTVFCVSFIACWNVVLILCIAVNIDDGSAHVRKAVQTPKPTPLRVGDADRPKTLQGDCIFQFVLISFWCVCRQLYF